MHRQAGVTGFSLHRLKNIEGQVRVVAALHIHFDCAVELSGALCDRARKGGAQIFAEIEAELCQLDGNVAGEIFRVHLLDHFDVAGADLAGGGFGGHVFAEMIEANGAALLAEFLAGGDGFRERFTSNEAAGEAVLHPATRDGTGDAALGGEPEDKVANQHEHPLGDGRRREYGDGSAASNGSKDQVLSKFRISLLALF